MSADAAQDRWRIKLGRRPNLSRMICFCRMAFITRIPPIAAFKPDRDDVGRTAMVNAPRLVIERLAMNDDAVDRPHLTEAVKAISLSFGG